MIAINLKLFAQCVQVQVATIDLEISSEKNLHSRTS